MIDPAARTEGKDTLHFRPSPTRTRVPDSIEAGGRATLGAKAESI